MEQVSGDRLRVESTRVALVDRKRLLLIFSAALMIRALCAVFFTGEIDGEGAEYARIAQNILSGKGYSGIATEGTQLFFPPLFPFLIAGISLITGDAEAAGRVVNVLFGALLVYPVYLIGRRIFGGGIGLGAAAVVAFHPYLVQFSTTVHSEPTYLTLVLAAVYSAMCVMDRPTWRACAVSGGLYGIAYLVRPEAFIFMLVGMAFILIGRVLKGERDLPKTAGRLLVMPICFLVVAGPYIGWLSLQTGQLRIEGKSPLNISTELRIQQGLSRGEAGMGVDEDLRAQGVWMKPNIDVIKAHHVSLPTLATMLAKKARRVVWDTSEALANNQEFGSPALFALAILGLFARPWRRGQTIDHLHVFALLSLTVFATFFIYYSGSRFYVLFLAFFCIWASAAAAGLMRWAKQSTAMLGLGRRQQVFAGKCALVLAVATVITPAAISASRELSTARGTRPVKAVSESLAASGMPLRFADASTPFAFHARADFVWLPYCSEATALRYLQEKHVTHVVVRERAQSSRPYLEKWMVSGVPNSLLVARAISDSGERVWIYDVRRASGG